MTINKTLIRGLIAFDICLLIGFYFWTTRPQPTPLLDGIVSYQSFEQLKMLPKFQNAKWIVKEDHGAQKDGTRPAPDMFAVEAKNYVHLGFKGEALFKFYGGRLMLVDFTPTQTALYKKALEKTLGIQLRPPTDFNPNDVRLGNTVFSYHPGVSSRGYFVFADSNLVDEANEWLQDNT